MTLKRRAVASGLDTSPMSASDFDPISNAVAYAILQTSGKVVLVGDNGTSPASPFWWNGTPPATWVSYSSTGTGTIFGGLVAGTRYQLNSNRSIGISRATPGTDTRVFTLSFYDASSGGNLLGTKEFTAEVNVDV